MVQCFEVYEHENYLYLILEYMDQKSLSDIIWHNHDRYSEDFCKYTLNSVAQGLAKMHNSNVLHRDIKPANLLLKKERSERPPRLKLADFGVSACCAQGGSLDGAGTVPYMSPEQLEAKNVRGTSDQYSLALIFYQLVSGHLPWPDHISSSQIIAQKMNGSLVRSLLEK